MQTCQRCHRIIRIVTAVVEVKIGSESAQEPCSITPVLEGDKAGTGIHTCTGQPVSGFTGEGSLSHTAKAMNYHQFSASEEALNLEQLLLPPNEAVTGPTGHLLTEAMRGGHLLG